MTVSCLFDNPHDLNVPDFTKFEMWIRSALEKETENLEVSVLICNEEEALQLNKQYRNKTEPTNILSFSNNYPRQIELDPYPIGDLALCPAVIEKEAKQFNIPLENHYAHLLIHGTLHLLGHDHINEEDTNKMQALEIELLAKFGIPDPYIQLSE